MHAGTFLQSHTQQGDLEEIVDKANRPVRQKEDNTLSLPRHLNEAYEGRM